MECIIRLDRQICRRISNTVDPLAQKMLYHSTLQLVVEFLTGLMNDFPLCDNWEKASASYNILRSFLSGAPGDSITKFITELRKHPKTVVEETIGFYRGRLETYIYDYYNR
jgi:hypothetical protein